VVAGDTPILVHNCGGDADLVDAVDSRYTALTTKGGPEYQSINQRGPVLSGVKDRLTGDIRLSQNYGGLPDSLHPSLASHLDEFGGINPYTGSSGVHGEIHGLNELLWARESAGLSTAIDDSFAFYSVRLRGAASGQQIPRCSICQIFTSGADEL
jgi:hypothetical protein